MELPTGTLASMFRLPSADTRLCVELHAILVEDFDQAKWIGAIDGLLAIRLLLPIPVANSATDVAKRRMSKMCAP
jgi:hypothetical protein